MIATEEHNYLYWHIFNIFDTLLKLDIISDDDYNDAFELL